MGASTYVPSMVFSFLAKDFAKQSPEVQADRKKLAKKVRAMYNGSDISTEADFSDDDLDCYEELFTLGLAKRCKKCKNAYTDWSVDFHKPECQEGKDED